jgi:hypothetical protein
MLMTLATARSGVGPRSVERGTASANGTTKLTVAPAKSLILRTEKILRMSISSSPSRKKKKKMPVCITICIKSMSSSAGCNQRKNG